MNSSDGSTRPSSSLSTYFGLPITGFAVQSFGNGQHPTSNGNVLSNYGGQMAHQFTRQIEVAQ